MTNRIMLFFPFRLHALIQTVLGVQHMLFKLLLVSSVRLQVIHGNVMVLDRDEMHA